MYHRSFLPERFFFGFILLSIALSACVTSSTPPVGMQTSPITQPTNAAITWPFHPNNDQWAIINSYRGNVDHAIGGSPNNYAHLALDFALCLLGKTNIVQGSVGTCDLSSGWNTANTDGKVVYSPVAGHVRWFDDGGSSSGSPCRSLGIELDSAPGYYIALAHVEQLYHNNDRSKPLKANDPVGQDEPIGVVSGSSGGGCYGGAHHIHMALYFLCQQCNPNTQREAVPFSDQWSISGCSLKDDGNTLNEYLGLLVPCHNTEVLTPSPTPSPTPTPTPSPTPTPLTTPTPSPTATPIPSTPVPVPTPTQPPKPTPPTPLLIMVQNVYTTDANQNVKTIFSPGDSIDYHVDAYNYQGTAVPVDVQFEVFAAGVGNYSYNETIHVNMPAGLSRFYTPKQIPTNATSDEYIVRITITQSNDQRNTDWGEGRFTIG